MSETWQHIVAYWRAGGVLLLVLAGISVGIWSMFFRSRRVFQCALGEVGGLAGCLDDAGRWGGCDDARVCLARLPGALAASVQAIVFDSRLSVGDSLDRLAERERAWLQRLQRDVIILGALTVVAPLVGLLGTVIGMIETFRVVGATGVDTAQGMAGGISRALITTQFGLVVAIPGVFGTARLERMRRQIETQLDAVRVQLRCLVDGVGRAPAESA